MYQSVFLVFVLLRFCPDRHPTAARPFAYIQKKNYTPLSMYHHTTEASEASEAQWLVVGRWKGRLLPASSLLSFVLGFSLSQSSEFISERRMASVHIPQLTYV